MLECPRKLKPIHKFRHNGLLFVADIEQYQLIEIDPVIWQILELCTCADNDHIIEKLSLDYAEEDILDALVRLEEMRHRGLLFRADSDEQFSRVPTEGNAGRRLKLIVYGTPPENLTYRATGTNVAQAETLKALQQYADLYFQKADVDPETRLFSVNYRLTEPRGLLRFSQQHFDGILLDGASDLEVLPLLRYLEVPVVLPIHVVRGHNGRSFTEVFLWNCAMKDYDAIYFPSDACREFYSSFAWDVTHFHTIHNGVDASSFYPMDKQLAKKQVADLVNDRRVMEMSVVGFLSRFQVEKGASIYIRLAERNPNTIFLAVAPTLNNYSLRELPSNLIYAGQQPRDKLVVFFNAFDVFCFPSMVGEENLPLTILEAMACGVPPVATDFSGLSEEIGDAGFLVSTRRFRHEIGSLVASVDVEDFSTKISWLLANQEQRHKLGKKARQRALSFTWDKTAQRLYALFQQLNGKKELLHRHRMPRFPVVFAPYVDLNERLNCHSILLSNTENSENPLMLSDYIQSVEEGLAIALLEHHTFPEVESVLLHVCEEPETAYDILHRVQSFLLASS